MTGKPYAEVIGDPIAHSKSPTIHNFWLGKLGIDAEYRACHVKPDKLGTISLAGMSMTTGAAAMLRCRTSRQSCRSWMS